MADTAALRQRRHRMHAQGNHALCRQCSARRAQAATLSEAWDAAALPAALPTAKVVQDRACTTLDPRAELEGLAARLVIAHETDPADAAVARELRATLLALPADAGAVDPLEELRDIASRVS